MNPHTGRIIEIGNDEAMARALSEGYELLPKELQADAVTVLAGRLEAQVNLRKSGPLQDWAKKKRREKIAAKSRRANRK
jgi:hypothetical protein